MFAALAWLVLDRVLHFALQGWLYRKLYPNGVPSFEKGQQEASAAVTDAVTKLVSVIHNVIQVKQAQHMQSVSAQISNLSCRHHRAPIQFHIVLESSLSRCSGSRPVGCCQAALCRSRPIVISTSRAIPSKTTHVNPAFYGHTFHVRYNEV